MAGMDLLIPVEDNAACRPVERVRLVNAAARMFETDKSGCLTWQKLQTRGQQHVIVQHQQVSVAQGGQAKLGRGAAETGVPLRNER